MSPGVRLLCAAVLALPLSACGGAQHVVRTQDEAARYIDDVMRGADPHEYKLADDATRTAEVAVEDAGALKRLRDAIQASGGRGCDVVGIIDKIGDAAPDSPAPVLDTGKLISVSAEANRLAIPSTARDPIVGAALEMAQSTWVKAADAACGVAQSF